jgi:hypothetical protein
LKNKLIFLLLLSVGLISGRSKFLGFFTFSAVAVLYFSNLKHLRMNFRTVLILAGMLAAMIFMTWYKIELYFASNIVEAATGSEEGKDFAARFILYMTSFEIFNDYFPFGSGFGSFATYSSGEYYSDIYVKYGIENVWGISKDYHSFISDTYYPSLAQFGVAGVTLYISFWVYIMWKSYAYFKAGVNEQIKYLFIVILITGFFVIEGIADSTFISYRGFFMLMLLGVTLSVMKKNYESITNQ